jgi:hypothetical protein
MLIRKLEYLISGKLNDPDNIDHCNRTQELRNENIFFKTINVSLASNYFRNAQPVFVSFQFKTSLAYPC